MKKDKEKKLTYFLRAAMMVLTTILIVLFLVIMSMVGKIQGTARVVNYAGLVRGGTQRMVKLEISGAPQDKMYETIYSYIEGLRNGSEKLKLNKIAARWPAKAVAQLFTFSKKGSDRIGPR